MRLRIRKLPIVLPLLLAAGLLAGTAAAARLGQNSVAAHTDLGRRYLADTDYTGAITEFLQGLSLNPTDREARMGLAEAYAASGSQDMVPEILAPLTESGSPEAYRLLIESQRELNPRQALMSAQELVDRTDEEEDYALRDELLAQVLGEAHSYAAGIDQRLLLSGGEVLSAGSNTLGQLGTGEALATEESQEEFLSAEFPGQAVRVYCGGRTSYAVDAQGNLWAAGENRWGQMGLDFASAEPEEGWRQIADTGDVAAAAGTAGSLFVLRTDGSLWHAGQGGGMELQRVRQFGLVMAVESGDGQTAVLTADGTLYLSDPAAPSSFVRRADGVKSFCIGGGGPAWVTEDNQIVTTSGVLYLPESWTWGGEGAVPDFPVRDLAADSDGLLLMDESGKLFRVYDGRVYEAENLTAVNIYSAGGTAVLEQEDGTVLLWSLDSPSPEPAA